MPTRIREYSKPTDWPTALQALRKPGTHPLITGPRPTDLAELGAEVVLDLAALNLAYIEQDEATLHIGGLTPLQALVDSALVQTLADGLLAEAAELAGGRGIRQVASVAGALQPGEGPPEIALALLALETRVAVRGDGEREVPLSELQLEPGEVVVEVRLEAQEHTHASLQRVARTPRDQAIVAAAVALEAADGLCRSARVAVAGAGPTPIRLSAVEALLADKALTLDLLTQAEQAAAQAAQPPADYRGSAAYRQAASGALVRRAIAEAWRRASE